MNTGLPSLESKIDVMQGAHYIQYMMEDIRVSYKRDVKVTVCPSSTQIFIYE